MNSTFLGLPMEFVWLPILIGLVIGIFFPLRPFVRSNLHFTIRPNEKNVLLKDADSLSKIIPDQSKDKLVGFCNIIRKLGLTLYIK